MKDDAKHLDDGGVADLRRFADLRRSQAGAIAREERLVRELGADIGFGRIMQLCESEWRKYLAERGHPTGGELTTGPCAALMVSCQCVEDAKPELDANGHCEWCCGTTRVTEKVRDAQRADAIGNLGRFAVWLDGRGWLVAAERDANGFVRVAGGLQGATRFATEDEARVELEAVERLDGCPYVHLSECGSVVTL